MVPASQTVRQPSPVLDGPVGQHLVCWEMSILHFERLSHLKCFVDIQSESDGVAEEEDEDDGEEERHHGGVPSVLG